MSFPSQSAALLPGTTAAGQVLAGLQTQAQTAQAPEAGVTFRQAYAQSQPQAGSRTHTSESEEDCEPGVESPHDDGEDSASTQTTAEEGATPAPEESGTMAADGTPQGALTVEFDRFMPGAQALLQTAPNTAWQTTMTQWDGSDANQPVGSARARIEADPSARLIPVEAAGPSKQGAPESGRSVASTSLLTPAAVTLESNQDSQLSAQQHAKGAAPPIATATEVGYAQPKADPARRPVGGETLAGTVMVQQPPTALSAQGHLTALPHADSNTPTVPPDAPRQATTTTQTGGTIRKGHGDRAESDKRATPQSLGAFAARMRLDDAIRGMTEMAPQSPSGTPIIAALPRDTGLTAPADLNALWGGASWPLGRTIQGQGTPHNAAPIPIAPMQDGNAVFTLTLPGAAQGMVQAGVQDTEQGTVQGPIAAQARALDQRPWSGATRPSRGVAPLIANATPGPVPGDTAPFAAMPDRTAFALHRAAGASDAAPSQPVRSNAPLPLALSAYASAPPAPHPQSPRTRGERAIPLSAPMAQPISVSAKAATSPRPNGPTPQAEAAANHTATIPLANDASGAEAPPLDLGDPLSRAIDGPALHRTESIAPRAAPMPHATPLPAAQQVVTRLADLTPNTPGFELALDPQELGHVTLRLSVLDGSSLLAIQAERPEVLELMRRHVHALQDELRNLGHTDLSLQFSLSGQNAGTGGAAPQDSGNSAGTEPPRTTHAAAPVTGPDPAAHTKRTGNAQLDLRL